MESWTVQSQLTGFRLYGGNVRVGGWDRRNRHLFVLESHVRTLPDPAAARDVLEGLGFRAREQPPGHCWWSVPDDELGTFMDALAALARLSATPFWEESLEPRPGPH